MSSSTSKAIAYFKPVIDPRDPATVVELQHDDTPVMKDIGRGLLVAYLVDEGDSFAYIQYRDLHNDCLTEDELHQIGIANLLTLADNNLRVVPHGNIFAVLLDGNFEASLLLLDVLWSDSFRQFVTGDYLVAIPNRDILAFCDRSSPAGRTELLEVMDRLKGLEDHPLSHELFVRNDSDWSIETKDQEKCC